MAPWNLSYAVIGASLLWVGWMGFNSGGALGAPDAPAGTATGGLHLLAVQTVAVLATTAWCAAASWVLMKITDAIVGLRVTTEQERECLDIVLHGERVF